jgi:hypothetical protein
MSNFRSHLKQNCGSKVSENFYRYKALKRQGGNNIINATNKDQIESENKTKNKNRKVRNREFTRS